MRVARCFMRLVSCCILEGVTALLYVHFACRRGQQLAHVKRRTCLEDKVQRRQGDHPQIMGMQDTPSFGSTSAPDGNQ